jgi:hypothetical protein
LHGSQDRAFEFGWSHLAQTTRKPPCATDSSWSTVVRRPLHLGGIDPKAALGWTGNKPPECRRSTPDIYWDQKRPQPTGRHSHDRAVGRRAQVPTNGGVRQPPLAWCCFGKVSLEARTMPELVCSLRFDSQLGLAQKQKLVREGDGVSTPSSHPPFKVVDASSNRRDES